MVPVRRFVARCDFFKEKPLAYRESSVAGVLQLESKPETMNIADGRKAEISSGDPTDASRSIGGIELNGSPVDRQ
jgi:hypothetical protein